MSPELAVKQASNNPYHGEPLLNQYELAASSVIRELCDRRGIKHQLENCDADVRKDIIESLAATIELALRSWSPSRAEGK